jgi:DGQHR domain-containing protein
MDNLISLFQNDRVTLTLTKKSIDWLVKNTKVFIFNPETFEGYQRKIDPNHVKKIVDFIVKGISSENFFMPTSITCARYNDDSKDTQLRVVDGQHRIFAFKEISQQFPHKYDKLKEIEIPVTIMSIDKSDQDIEIDTFITINKTSKRVDTSLALILKNKINALKTNNLDINSLKSEYFAVEVAKSLNDDFNSLWFEKISYEGLPKDDGKLISLNGFVSSLRLLISALNRKRIINLNWSETGLNSEEIAEQLSNFMNRIWFDIYDVYSELLIKNERSIIQGTIGFSAFNHFIKDNLLDGKHTLSEVELEFKNRVSRIRNHTHEWYSGETISRNSSSSGHKYVSTLISSWTRAL